MRVSMKWFTGVIGGTGCLGRRGKVSRWKMPPNLPQGLTHGTRTLCSADRLTRCEAPPSFCSTYRWSYDEDLALSRAFGKAQGETYSSTFEPCQQQVHHTQVLFYLTPNRLYINSRENIRHLAWGLLKIYGTKHGNIRTPRYLPSKCYKRTMMKIRLFTKGKL